MNDVVINNYYFGTEVGIKQKVSEEKDVKVYKRMVSTMADYLENIPNSLVYPVFNGLVAGGVACMPKDEKMLDILHFIFTHEKYLAVNTLLNHRFADLPIQVRPEADGKVLSIINKDGKVSDRVLDLINGKEWSNNNEGDQNVIVPETV